MPEQKIKNPFMHQHDDHDHDHDHHHHEDDGEMLAELDPAQQSLADALRVSFTILKVIMVVLLLAYFASGVFRVEEGTRAVRLQFGSITGDEIARVYEPGWYFGWPYPIEEKLHIPVTPRTLATGNAFWYETAGRAPDQPRMGPLNPERDGSLLTGDANVVHGRFEVTYVVDDAVLFVENVGLARPGQRLADGRVAQHELDLADDLVRGALEQGVVYAVAQVEADEFIDGRMERGLATARMQEVLDALGAGIDVTNLTVEERMPQPVQDAYQAVVRAETERGEAVDRARQERSQILGQTAGRAHEALIAMIAEYEAARELGDADAAAAVLAGIDQALGTLQLPAERGGLRIGGDVAAVINEAVTERTAVVEQVQAEAHTFQSLLEEYRARPRLLTTRLWQDAKENILTGDIETFYTMGGHFYPVINRDPAIEREREERRLRQEREQRQPGQR